ncbi:MAG: DUF5693 family protein, partial [Bacillota bacterium]|nr:DUF5693 family protein [Bacillota bacterium]
MSKIRKLYVLLIIMSVLVCLYGVYQRIRVEKEYNRYEMVMGLQDIKIFASEGGRDLIDVLKTFKKIGIHTVIVDEASIESLRENERYRLRTEYHGPDIHLQAEPELLKFIEDGIKRTIKDDRKIYYASPDVLVIEGRLSDINSIKKTNNLPEEKVSEIEKMGLGYLEQELHFLKKLQIRYALRPSFSPKLQDGKKTIDAFFAAVSKHNPNQNFILFGGKKILGGPENLAYLQEMTERFHMIPIIIENGQQDGNIDIAGVRDLVRSMDYRTVRLFSTWPFIQKRYDYGISGHHEGQEIVNTYYRAITERNIRIIYFRLFVTPGEEYVTDLNIYQQRLAELRERLDYFYGIKPVV